jgi:hypothetical protein
LFGREAPLGLIPAQCTQYSLINNYFTACQNTRKTKRPPRESTFDPSGDTSVCHGQLVVPNAQSWSVDVGVLSTHLCHCLSAIDRPGQAAPHLLACVCVWGGGGVRDPLVLVHTGTTGLQLGVSKLKAAAMHLGWRSYTHVSVVTARMWQVACTPPATSLIPSAGPSKTQTRSVSKVTSRHVTHPTLPLPHACLNTTSCVNTLWDTQQLTQRSCLLTCFPPSKHTQPGLCQHPAAP